MAPGRSMGLKEEESRALKDGSELPILLFEHLGKTKEGWDLGVHLVSRGAHSHTRVSPCVYADVHSCAHTAWAASSEAPPGAPRAGASHVICKSFVRHKARLGRCRRI